MPQHYYIESERVTTKLGGGFQPAPLNPMTDHVQYPIGKDYANLAEELWERLKYTEECTGLSPNYVTGEHNNLLYAVDQWVGMDQYESNAFYYHSDHLGSSSLITDANGNLDQHYQYLPYGEPFVSQKMNTGVRFTFSGKERDTETNLSYFGARYYSSDVSVWLSVDPLAHKSPNETPYHYCSNNPLNRIDPLGLTDYRFNKRTGKLSIVEGTEDDGPDRIIKGKPKYDGDGNLKNNSSKVLELDGKIEDFETNDKYQTYSFSKSEDAEKAYKFLCGMNMNIEIAKWVLEDRNGNLSTHFFTSGHKDKVAGEYKYLMNLKKENPYLKILRHTHNHGNPSSPSTNLMGTYSPSPEDKDFARSILFDLFRGQTPKTQFYIFRFGTYTPYDHTGPLK